MFKLNYKCLLILIVGFCFSGLHPAFSQEYSGERILDFHSDIVVNPDNSLTVIETISVWVEGESIKRGIYRDIPTAYKDKYGNIVRIGVEFLSVTRDGKPEPNLTEMSSTSKRIYFGERFVHLEKHKKTTYTMTYRVTRSLGFYNDHDELYWNVTGNGWGFLIEKASATVHLPPGINRDQVQLTAATGYLGESGDEYTSGIDDSGAIQFSMQSALMPGEGFTIVVSFPKGFVQEPSQQNKLSNLLSDNFALLVILAGLAIVLPYYFMKWSEVGRDLPAGVIIPLYSPPDDLSPAALRYIYKLGFDERVMTSSYINMAVKGFWEIKLETGIFTFIRKAPYDISMLSDEEKVIAETFVRNHDQFTLNSYRQNKITRASDKVKNILSKKYEKLYFNSNSSYSNMGIAISAVAIIIMLITLFEQGDMAALLAVSFGSLCIIAAGAIIIPVVRGQWRLALHRNKGNKKAILWASAVTLFFIPLSLLVLYIPFAFNILLPTIASLLIGINWLFRGLLKAPTREGRNLLDRIEGFKKYLSYAEKERLAVISQVREDPEVFEKYLPYATALDIEDKWSFAFMDSLDTMGLVKAEYKPEWFSGDNFLAFAKYGFAASSIVKVGDAFLWNRNGRSSISGKETDRTSQNKSGFGGFSSGGGTGGSSGGGRGGGGGGGW